MDQVREVASAASSLRKAKKLRVRLPLPKLTVAVENPQRLEPFKDLIADELNVKSVELTDDIAAYGRFELTVNARVAGPRLGKDVQAAIKAVKAGEARRQRRRHADRGPGRAAARGVQLAAGGRRPRVHRRAARRRGSGGARRHRDAGTGGRGLGQGPHPRTAGPAQVHRPRRVRPDLGGHRGARRHEAQWARTHSDLIAGEILATSFEFGEPADGTEIGDGVRVRDREGLAAENRGGHLREVARARRG